MFIAQTGSFRQESDNNLYTETQKSILQFSYGLGVASRYARNFIFNNSQQIAERLNLKIRIPEEAIDAVGQTTKVPRRLDLRVRPPDTNAIGKTSPFIRRNTPLPLIESGLYSSLGYRMGSVIANGRFGIFNVSANIFKAASRGVGIFGGGLLKFLGSMNIPFVGGKILRNATKRKATGIGGIGDSVRAAIGKPKMGFSHWGTLITAGLTLAPIVSAFFESKKAIDDTYSKYGMSLTAPAKLYGPGYDTAAVKYSLNANMQNRQLSPLAQSTEGLSLAMYNLRHRGYL